MLLWVTKGHEERRDSFVKTALFLYWVSGINPGINKCYENSRPSVNLRFLILIPLSLPDFNTGEQERPLNYVLFFSPLRYRSPSSTGA